MEKADGKTEGIHQSVWQGTKKPSHGLPIGHRFPQITVVPGNSCPGESNPDLSRCGGRAPKNRATDYRLDIVSAK